MEKEKKLRRKQEDRWNNGEMNRQGKEKEKHRCRSEQRGADSLKNDSSKMLGTQKASEKSLSKCVICNICFKKSQL